MHRRVVTASLALAGLLAGAPLWAATVAVAPFSSTSSTEYQWIGPGLAQALCLRLLGRPDISAYTVRQVNAAMHDDNIDAAGLANDETAFGLGRQLGADVLVVGTFEAAWPDIKIVVRTLDPSAKKVLQTEELTGDLDQLFDLEAKAARGLAPQLGAALGTVAPGGFGTRSLRAWRDTTLALEILNWQSLSPRAADPNVPINLPETAVTKARTYLEQATKADPKFLEAAAGLALAQLLLGDAEGARKSLATASAGNVSPTAVLITYFAQMREGRFDDALRTLDAAITARPGFLHARGYLGDLYNHLGRHREARAAFEQYHQKAPKNPWVLAQLGYTKSKLKDHLGAISDTIAAVDLVPDSPSLLIQLASRYIDGNKLAGAEDALMHALELFPDEARIYVRLGYVYLRQDKLDLAIPISEKGLALAQFEDRRKDRGYAHLNLARAFGRLGDLDRAFEHLGKAKECGIASFTEVESDPALATLRADARWAAGGYR
jgi:tetratricopeptide (TPR) repeat protein